MSFQAIDRRLIYSINSPFYSNLRAEKSGISSKTEPSDGTFSKDIIEEKSGNTRINPFKSDEKNGKIIGSSPEKSSPETINTDDKSGNSDMANTAFEVTSELILQPNQAPITTGGGGGNYNGDWGYEDKKKRRSGRRR